MKTVLEYLKEKKEVAWYNRLCYSKTYTMETPQEGYENEFAEAVRDCEIVEELLMMAQDKEMPIKQTSPCECLFKTDISKILQLFKEIESYVSA